METDGYACDLLFIFGYLQATDDGGNTSGGEVCIYFHIKTSQNQVGTYSSTFT